jgi:hypothetical protein
MIQTEPEKKPGFLDKLPKVGRASQLFIILVIFLLVFIGIYVIYQQQPKTQANLNNTLSNLQKIVGVTETPKAKYEAELAQVTTDAEAAKAVFPTINQSPEILDSLLQLAELNDVSVTQTKVTTITPKATKTAANQPLGPILTIELGLKGQIPKFQNFLLAVDSKLPTAQIRTLAFTTAVSETEEDTGRVLIDIFCYGGSQ